LNVSGLTDSDARRARATRTAETVTRERCGGTRDQRMARRLVQAFWGRKASLPQVAGACRIGRSNRPHAVRDRSRQSTL